MNLQIECLECRKECQQKMNERCFFLLFSHCFIFIVLLFFYVRDLESVCPMCHKCHNSLVHVCNVRLKTTLKTQIIPFIIIIYLYLCITPVVASLFSSLWKQNDKRRKVSCNKLVTPQNAWSEERSSVWSDLTSRSHWFNVTAERLKNMIFTSNCLTSGYLLAPNRRHCV